MEKNDGNGVESDKKLNLGDFLRTKLNGSEPKRLAIVDDVPEFIKLFLADSQKAPDLGLDSQQILNEEDRSIFGGVVRQMRGKYRLARGTLDLMGPIGYTESDPKTNTQKTELEVTSLAAALMVLAGNTSITWGFSEKWRSAESEISMGELEALVGATLLLSVRELKQQGKKADSKLSPDKLEKIVYSLREPYGVHHRDGKRIRQSHEFVVGLDLLDSLVPPKTPGAKQWREEFETYLQARGNKAVAADVHGFWLVLAGAFWPNNKNLWPALDKKLSFFKSGV